MERGGLNEQGVRCGTSQALFDFTHDDGSVIWSKARNAKDLECVHHQQIEPVKGKRQKITQNSKVVQIRGLS